MEGVYRSDSWRIQSIVEQTHEKKILSFQNLNATRAIASAILYVVSFVSRFGHELLRMDRNR
jgi:hypothetical protein